MDPKTPIAININSSYVINNFYGKSSTSKKTLNHLESKSNSAKNFYNINHLYHEEEIIQSQNSKSNEIFGYFLLISAFLYFFSSCFLFVFSIKFDDMPSENDYFSFLRNDFYYSLLFPLSFPIIVVLIYSNWVAAKFFRHS